MSGGRGTPRVLVVSKRVRTASIEKLRELALREPADQMSRDANEWYWVARFGHTLVNHYNVKGLLALTTVYARDLDQEKVGDLTPRDLEILSRSESRVARNVAAQHVRTPVAALARLASDEQVDVRKSVGRNPRTPARSIAQMRARGRESEIDERRLQFLWAEVDAVPVNYDVALEIARSPEPDDDVYRRALAKRRGLPVDVRIAIAQNRLTPTGTLLNLANDRDKDVRLAASCNPALPNSARERLLEDDDRSVRRAVVVQGRFDPDVIVGMDRDDMLRPHVQERLIAGDWVWSHHRPNDSDDVPRDLAESPHPGTRAAVAMCRTTPLGVLDVLACDREPSVVRAVKDGLGFEVVDQKVGDRRVLAWWWRRDLTEAELLTLARSPRAVLRACAASRLPRGQELRTLVDDGDPDVRLACAHNTSLSLEGVLRLADDLDPRVRRAAEDAARSGVRARHRTSSDMSWNDGVGIEDVDPIPINLPVSYWSPWAPPRVQMHRIHLGAPGFADPFWPDDAIEQFAVCENPNVRVVAAGYRGSPTIPINSPLGYKLSRETIDHLCEDPDDEVRTVALATRHRYWA